MSEYISTYILIHTHRETHPHTHAYTHTHTYIYIYILCVYVCVSMHEPILKPSLFISLATRIKLLFLAVLHLPTFPVSHLFWIPLPRAGFGVYSAQCQISLVRFPATLERFILEISRPADRLKSWKSVGNGEWKVATIFKQFFFFPFLLNLEINQTICIYQLSLFLKSFPRKYLKYV